MGTWGIAQLEQCPDTRRLHIQGMCAWNSNQTLTAVKKVHSTAHWEVCIDFQASIEYCSKYDTRIEGTEPFEWGARPIKRQGKRTDLHEAVDTMKNTVGGPMQKLKAAALECPTVFVKFHKGLEALAQITATPVKQPVPVWYTWQQQLDLYLGSNPGHSRWIFWIYDEVGGCGKSTFVRSYIQDATKDAVALEGKIADMAYTYQSEKVVFFDVSRVQGEHMDHLYGFAEKLKNGYIHSTKYTPVKKYFAPPHVIFFSNAPPAEKKWSVDRMKVCELSAGHLSSFPDNFFSQALIPPMGGGGGGAPNLAFNPGNLFGNFDAANPLASAIDLDDIDNILDADVFGLPLAGPAPAPLAAPPFLNNVISLLDD